jgi:dTDP-4-amino-4,6-dideoxygalactose transaminase
MIGKQCRYDDNGFVSQTTVAAGEQFPNAHRYQDQALSLPMFTETETTRLLQVVAELIRQVGDKAGLESVGGHRSCQSL